MEHDHFLDRSDTVQLASELPRSVALKELSVVDATTAFGVSPQFFQSAKEAFETSGFSGLLQLVVSAPAQPSTLEFADCIGYRFAGSSV